MRGFRRIAPTLAVALLTACIGTSSGGVGAASCGWFEYRNPVHGFRICVPADLTVLESAGSKVVQAAVVRFGPTFDGSIRADGTRTNLLDLQVVIGVTDRCSTHLWTDRHSSLRAQTRIVGGTEFLVYRSVEGAVGNRYETLSYVTATEGRQFEIALFLHYADPGCYVPGTIALFDRVPIDEWFERMVCSFSVY